METSMWNDAPRAAHAPAKGRRAQAGFTLLEMIVAMVVMMVGLIALAQTIGFALVASNKGRNVTNSKLLVVSILEQMETLRNAKQLTFDQIANVGNVNNANATQNFAGFPLDFGAGYPAGFGPVSINPGPDGIYGTADDLTDAGPDGIYGTADDYQNPALARTGYIRQIVITSLSSDLKRIQVTLKSPGASGKMDTITGVSYLNNDANSNFLP
jgi:prepilin-type N-terminal cleavage/methylation domain-containing protein